MEEGPYQGQGRQAKKINLGHLHKLRVGAYGCLLPL